MTRRPASRPPRRRQETAAAAAIDQAVAPRKIPSFEELLASSRARAQAAFEAHLDHPDRRGVTADEEDLDGHKRIADDASPWDLVKRTQRRREAARWNGPLGSDEAAVASAAEPVRNRDGQPVYFPLGEVVGGGDVLRDFARRVEAQEARWREEGA